MDAAKANIIDWLADEALQPGVSTVTSDMADALGSYIAGKVVPQVDASSADRRALRKAEADHFWCDLLAQIACAMNRLDELFDQVPDEIVAAIWASRQQDGRSVIEKVAIEIAVKGVINGIRTLTPLRHFDDTARTTKILAILTCPAPEKHRAVVACCSSSLENEVISDLVSERILEVLPKDWPGR